MYNTYKKLLQYSHNIYDASTLDTLGWNISLTTFRIMKTLCSLTIFILSFSFSTIIFKLFTELLNTNSIYYCYLFTILIHGYITIIYVFREVCTHRKFTLIHHENINFFRALHIPKIIVIISEYKFKLMIITSITGGIDTSLLIHSTAHNPIICTLLTFLLFINTLLVLINVTLSTASQRIKKFPNIILIILSAIAAGLFTGFIGVHLYTAITQNTQIILSHFSPTQTALYLCLLCLLIVCIGLSYTAHQFIVRIITSDFQYTNITIAQHDIVQLPINHLIWIKILLSNVYEELRLSTLSQYIYNIWFFNTVLLYIYSTCKTALDPIFIEKTSHIIVTLALLLSLTLNEFMARCLSPVKLTYQLRTIWEQSTHTLYKLSIIPLCTSTTIILLVLLPLIITNVIIFHSATFMIVNIISVTALTWIALSTTSDTVMTRAFMLNVGIFSVLTGTGLFIVYNILFSHSLQLLAIIITIFLFGGAIWLAKQRILRLPLQQKI